MTQSAKRQTERLPACDLCGEQDADCAGWTANIWFPETERERERHDGKRCILVARFLGPMEEREHE